MSRQPPIVHAVANGDSKMNEQFLINAADIKEDPMVLCVAVFYRILTFVENLLKNGADPNVIDKSILFRGQSPLHIAVDRNRVEIVKLLIKYGADVNVKDREGETPIMYAIDINNTEMIELLLTNGADIKEDPKVLYSAVEKGNLKIVEDLLKNGADPNMIYNSCLCGTLVHSACTLQIITPVMEMISNGVSLNSKYKYTYDLSVTPLHVAVRWERVEIVKLLIKYGADVNVKDGKGETPIIYAIQQGNTEMIELLLTNGADIKEDPMVLCIAVFYGNLKIVEDLLKNGADPNMINLYTGKTIIHTAVDRNEVEMAKLLIKYGADVNVKDGKGETPIIYVIGRRNTEMIELFLTNGAEIKEDVNTDLLRVDCPTTTILLKQHIAKMKAAGLYVSERNLLLISNDYEINNFLNECEAEIQIMKSEKIDNSCASFYDILTKNESQLAKNESIVQAFKSDGYKTKFPIYASTIDSRFRRGLEREELLEQFRKKFLHSLLESLSELPFLCTEKIFSYLSDRDLRILLLA